MTTFYHSSIESGVAEYARQAERWFERKFIDRPAFEKRLRAGLHFMGHDEHAENKIELTRSLGMFSIELFQAMICGGTSFKPMYVSVMWDRLFAAGVVFKAMAAMKGIPFADHQIDEVRLLMHLRDATFANLFASPARLPERYKNAVVAVDVAKGGDRFRGTGFVVMNRKRPYFVSCKHNVDPSESIVVNTVTSASGQVLRLGPIKLSDRYDIATAALDSSIEGPCFALSEAVETFDEVFTLGYPYVPRAEPLLLGHRGEVNGRTNLYVEKCPALIISNLVSPGSSGGPVLSRDGHCVGMTINWLEGEWAEGEKETKMRFSAALPAELVREAIEATP